MPSDKLKEAMRIAGKPPAAPELLTDEEVAEIQHKSADGLLGIPKSPPLRLASAENLVAERKGQHGDWAQQAALAADLKRMIRRHTETAQGSKLTTSQQEALEMICVKISRICCGDPNHMDHWSDIGGYALLGAEGHKR